MRDRTQYITLSALFMAMGVLIPMVFHATGLGNIFLPMFWPVALSAFFLPVGFSAAVGALTPTVSTLFTGMPPVSPPIFQIMVVEMVSLTTLTSLLYHNTRWGNFWALALGLLVSRGVLFICAGFLAPILGLPPEVVSIASVIKGVPGILTMLVIIPLILNRIKHENIFLSRKHYVTSP
jgi:hypothetical protein